MQKVTLVPEADGERFRIEAGQASTAFMTFCQQFGFNFYTIRGRIKRGAFDAWEVSGMKRIVSDYAGYDVENVYDWFAGLGNRTQFLKVLSGSGMCEKTAWGFFTRRDLLAWQMVGMREITDRFNDQNKD